MKRENIVKHVIAAFFLAVVLYFLCYSLIEYRRSYKGPWTVTFLTDPRGKPAILINQKKLKISGFKIVFPDQTVPAHNVLRTVRFDGPGKKTPFGEVVFVDTTFLPGTVVLNIFGHEIQLIPSALTVDKKDYLWQWQTTISAQGPGKYQPPTKPRR